MQSNKFDETIGDWAAHCKDCIQHIKITEQLSPKHVTRHYLQKGDHPDPSDLKGELPPGCESVFRNVQEYNLAVSWGAIIDHMVDKEINGNGSVRWQNASVFGRC